MPQTVTGFEWSSDAAKSLAGQGDLYVRLIRDFSASRVASGVMEDSILDDRSESSVVVESAEAPPSTSTLPPAEPTAQASLPQPSVYSVCLTRDALPSSDDEPKK